MRFDKGNKIEFTICEDYGDANDENDDASEVDCNYNIKDKDGNDDGNDDVYDSDDTNVDDGEEVAADVSL